MTGYARSHGSVPGIAFSIEIRSVNARGLDIRMRLTPGYDALEPELRRRIGKALTRGSVGVNLTIEREGEGGRVAVNHTALDAVLVALGEISGKLDAEKPTLDGILGLKGVLEQHEAPLEPEAEDALATAIYAALDRALADLQAARRQPLLDVRSRRRIKVAVHLRPFEQFAVGAHAIELAGGDEVVMDVVDFAQPLGPGRDRNRELDIGIGRQHGARDRGLARPRGRCDHQHNAAAGERRHELLEVLHLLAELVDHRLEVETDRRQLHGIGFRAERIRFAVKFL
jgi:hypothetical protein